MKISICIPTYNRAVHLANCLNSIALSDSVGIDFEVCVSDNCSSDDTQSVIRAAVGKLPIRCRRNSENVGIPRNFLSVVNMAQGDFAWLLGDDDLLLPTGLRRLSTLIDRHSDVEFFYVNCFHLTTDWVLSQRQPFDTAHLPEHMKPFSPRTESGELPFLELVNPNVSFDFLGGMFLSVFRRKNWLDNVGVLDTAAICDKRQFSSFDNTFPHVKIFAAAFSKSKAYFNADPLAVCLTGAREWSPMYALVHSVRLVEALEEFRKNGLPYRKYWLCKNYALNNFIPDIVSMFVSRKKSGFDYIDPVRLILQSCLFPNFYFSFINYFIRKLKVKWTAPMWGASKSTTVQ